MKTIVGISIVAVCVSLLLSSPAPAQPIFTSANSLECTVVQANVIVVGKIVEFDKEKRLARIAVEETLKGKPVESLSVLLVDSDSELASWKAHGSRLMVTLDQPAEIAKVLDLTMGELEVITADFEFLHNADDVIRIVKNAVRRLSGKKEIQTFRINVPFKAHTGTTSRTFYPNFSLYVPVDDRLEKRAIEYITSKDHERRKEGARALGHFKSDANITRLKQLLADPHFVYLRRPEENFGVEVRLYEIRQSAQNALDVWGVKFEKSAVRVEKLNDDIEQVLLGKLNDEALQRLRGFKKLREVSFYANCDDDDLKKLATLTQIQRLSVTGIDNQKVTDTGIKGLWALTNLSVLELHCPNLTDAGLKELAPLTNLTTLDLAAANMNGSGLKELAGLNNLTTLELQNTRVNDAALKELTPLRNLTTLNLNGTRVTDAGLKELASLTNLTTLDLTGIRVTPAGLKELAPLKKLTKLDFWSHLLTDTSLRTLREVDLLHALVLATGKDGARPKSADEVVALDLSETKVNDAGLKELTAFKNLTTLYLPKTVTDLGLKDLAQFKNLSTLYLGRSRVTDDGLRELAKLKNLSRLSLPLTDARLRILRDIGLLHVLDRATGKEQARPKFFDEVLELNLAHTQVANEGIKELAALKNLNSLSLYNTKITDGGLQHLAGLAQLRWLDLHATAVTDEGLKHLERLTELRELSLVNSKVTLGGVYTLRKALPKCRVVVK